MANASRLSCFDPILVGGLTYLLYRLNSNLDKIECKTPIAGWQLSFYFMLLGLRLFLYIYCVSTKLARCALFSLLAILMPVLVVMTVMGQHYYGQMRSDEPDCYPASASPWSLVMSLSLGWFLTYVYLLLGCTALYN